MVPSFARVGEVDQWFQGTRGNGITAVNHAALVAKREESDASAAPSASPYGLDSATISNTPASQLIASNAHIVQSVPGGQLYDVRKAVRVITFSTLA